MQLIETYFRRKKKTSNGSHPSYWSNQQNGIQPYCTFTPSSALNVSTLVLLSCLTQCPFAAKSGGHAAFKGASSIEGGITIDLAGLTVLELSGDKKTVVVGPSHIWYDVYNYLDPHGLAVVGGRAASVGVGGLTVSSSREYTTGLEILTAFSAWRWHFPSHQQAWSGMRQRCFLGGGHCIRSDSDGESKFFPRLVLGSQGWRQQFWHRYYIQLRNHCPGTDVGRLPHAS